jgi:hypothetical protein
MLQVPGVIIVEVINETVIYYKIGYNVRVWEEASCTIWRQAAAVTIEDSVMFEETHSLLRTTINIKTASVNLAVLKIRSQVNNDKNYIHSFIHMCPNLVQCTMFLTLLYSWEETDSLKSEFRSKKKVNFTL